MFAGQCRLVELGFRQGGVAGYGLRRILIDQSGAAKSALGKGEQKSLQTDRVILVPGPDEEIRIVYMIYRWFIDDGLVEADIARRLNGISVSEKTGLCQEYICGIVRLLKDGEEDG